MRAHPRFSRAHLLALAIGAAIVLILAAIGFGAKAQPACFPSFQEADAILGEHYGEALIAEGMAGGRALHIFVSPERTFTILATRPGGMSCIVAGGTDFGFIAPRPRPAPGKDS